MIGDFNVLTYIVKIAILYHENRYFLIYNLFTRTNDVLLVV